MPQLTHWRHFGHLCLVRSVWKLRLVVVDVLDLDDELGLGFDGQVGGAVAGLSAERVVGLLFAVQPLGGVDVARVLVDCENGGGSFTSEDVLDPAFAFIHI